MGSFEIVMKITETLYASKGINLETDKHRFSYLVISIQLGIIKTANDTLENVWSDILGLQ